MPTRVNGIFGSLLTSHFLRCKFEYLFGYIDSVISNCAHESVLAADPQEHLSDRPSFSWHRFEPLLHGYADAEVTALPACDRPSEPRKTS
jgi:hypothetical protein